MQCLRTLARMVPFCLFDIWGPGKLCSKSLRNQKHARWQCLLMPWNILKWVPAATLPAGNNKISIQVQLSRWSSCQETILKIIEPRITLAPRTMVNVTKQGQGGIRRKISAKTSCISQFFDLGITPGSTTLQRGWNCLRNCCFSVWGFLFWFGVLSVFHLQHFGAGSCHFPHDFGAPTSHYPSCSHNFGARTVHVAIICMVFFNQGPFRIGLRWL